ncbi:TPA: hypothetical protein ACPUG2_002603 [Klebsiella pneumoniae]
MSDVLSIVRAKNNAQEWVTIQEAVEIVTQKSNVKMRYCDILRNALYGNILISIYFQSPVILRKVNTSNYKIKLTPGESSFYYKLCHLDSVRFLNDTNLIVSTEDIYFTSNQRVIDTPLIGYEYVFVERLLAQLLKLPLPKLDTSENNYGISVCLDGNLYQIFEKTTWEERIKKQINHLPKSIAPIITEQVLYNKPIKDNGNILFPLYHLPKNTCFVIRNEQLDKLLRIITKNKSSVTPSSRISTPLSRLFWLACKHNESITPLINKPYKLLSIFEQWALSDGITDHLSAETLKSALQRGSPSETSSSH